MVEGEALMARKRELLSMKKNYQHHEFFDLDKMGGAEVEAAIRKMQEAAGVPLAGAKKPADKSRSAAPGDDWDVVASTSKKGHSIPVDEKKVKTFKLWDKAQVLPGNLLKGLTRFDNVITPSEETHLANFVADQLQKGRKSELRGSTLVVPPRGSRHPTQLQYGIAYNYQDHSVGGRHQVEVMPAVLEELVQKLIAEGIVSASQKPNTAVVNVYDEGCSLPPHIDSKSFTRPICTVSLNADADMLFGEKAGRIDKTPTGAWEGCAVPLPRRSVLLLPDEVCANDVEHCIPPVKAKRISITFRATPKR